ncbi:hypothetical protein Tco_0453316 [Tanacetum coccineum]
MDEEIYMKQPEGFVMPGHENSSKISTKEFLSSNFDMKDLGEAEVILDPTVKFQPNYKETYVQLEYYRAFGVLYAMISTRQDIAFPVLKLSRLFRSRLELINMEDHSSTSGWVFILGGGAIFWASKKETCITSSTMESKFVVLAATGNEAKWLRNLVYEIPLWPKPMSTISIRCDSAATLAKAYSQVYNRKSRHLGVRHSMVHELIMNGMISVEFVRTQLNLDDHLTKGLARDLVRKAAIGMGLKST